LIPATWVIGVVVTTDRSVQRADVRRFKKVLVIFPHPDDETVDCGGTVNRMARAGAHMTVLLLTLGERGNLTGLVDPELKVARRAEAVRATDILGVSRLIQEDLGDGRIDERREEAGRQMATAIDAVRPDLIVTYDRAGLDGHANHVACAEVLTELRRSRFPDIALWYAGQPRRLVRLLQAVGQLARDEAVDRRRAAPTIRIVVGAGVVPKIRAWYAHRSQRRRFAKALGRLVPMWLAFSVQQSEYFAEAD